MSTFPQIEKRIKRAWTREPQLLIGAPGIGKTQFCIGLADTLDLQLVKLDLSQNGDNTDLIGLLQVVDGVHSHTCPWWMNTDKPVLLFIDEPNRASDECKNAIMQMCSPEQKFNGRALPEGSRVICAINPASADNNDVEELNRALFSRFNVHFVEVDAKHWCEVVAPKVGIHPIIIEYIKAKGVTSLFNMNESDDKEDLNKVNPRSWENFSHAFENGFNQHVYEGEDGFIELYEDAKGRLGPDEAQEFITWFKNRENYISAEDLLNAKGKKFDEMMNDIAKMDVQSKCNLVDRIASYLGEVTKEDKVKPIISNNFAKFFLTIEADLQQLVNTSYFQPMSNDEYEGIDWMGEVFGNMDEDLISKVVEVTEVLNSPTAKSSILD